MHDVVLRISSLELLPEMDIHTQVHYVSDTVAVTAGDFNKFNQALD